MPDYRIVIVYFDQVVLVLRNDVKMFVIFRKIGVFKGFLKGRIKVYFYQSKFEILYDYLNFIIDNIDHLFKGVLFFV